MEDSFSSKPVPDSERDPMGEAFSRSAAIVLLLFGVISLSLILPAISFGIECGEDAQGFAECLVIWSVGRQEKVSKEKRGKKRTRSTGKEFSEKQKIYMSLDLYRAFYRLACWRELGGRVCLRSLSP